MQVINNPKQVVESYANINTDLYLAALFGVCGVKRRVTVQFIHSVVIGGAFFLTNEVLLLDVFGCRFGGISWIL